MEHLKTFFLQNFAKLKDLYLSMTLGNRIVASLLATTLLVSLGYLVVGSIPSADPTSKTVKLFGGYNFSSNEKRAAEYALANANLSEHHWIGDQLQVPTSKRPLYTLTLAAENIPEKTNFARVIEASNLSPWHSRALTETKMNPAKEKDFVDAVRMIPGIANATVISNKRPSWERNVWARTNIPSLSVTVEVIENKPLGLDTIGVIGHMAMVAFGILDVKDIRIADTRHKRVYNGAGEEQSTTEAAYLRHQEKYQEVWDNKIYKLLSGVEGLTVTTSIDLTKYEYIDTFIVEHGKPTELVTHKMGYDYLNEGYAWFARPGAIAMWNRTQIDPSPDVNPKNRIKETKHEQEITNALQGTETKQGDLPYIPVRIFATISVPRDHILALWKEKNRQLGGDPEATPQPEELLAEEENFRQVTKQNVAQLLRPYLRSSKEDPLDLVVVNYFTRILSVEKKLTSWEQFVQFMQDNWHTLGLMSLVFCGLGVLWAVSKPPKEPPIVIIGDKEMPIDVLDARIAEKQRRDAEAAAAAERERLAAEEEEENLENSLGELGSLRSLKDEIAELIARNPEAAAAVIRQWIGNAMMVEAKS